MKNTTFLFFFTFLSFNLFSQVVETKIYAVKKVKWDEDDEMFYKTPQDYLSDSSNFFINLSYDIISLSMGDKTNFYLNQAPTEREDSATVERIWFKVVNDSSANYFLHLFYYKSDDTYVLRVVNRETDKGYEFYLNPLMKEGDIPKKKKR